MESKSFSISSAVSYGWQTIMNNLQSIFGILLVFFLLSLFPSLFIAIVHNRYIAVFLSLVSFVLSLGLTPGMVNLCLKMYNKEKVTLATLFSGFKYFTDYFLADLAYSIIVICGILLFIVPGVIWGIQFGFFIYFLVDKNMSPTESLRMSSDMTKGQRWNIFVLYLVLALINVAGIACLLIGYIFITLPLTFFALTYVYKELTKEPAEEITVERSDKNND